MTSTQRALRNDAEFIDTYFDSIGHDVCTAPPTRWFEGLVPTEPAYPLHPNAKGEASMGRSALEVLSKPSPGDKAPRVTGLQVFPRRVHGREVTIRFELNRAAKVTLTRKLAGARRPGPSRSKPRSLAPPVSADPGLNAIQVRARRLGSRAGRYRLLAKPVASDGKRGRIARAHYRVPGRRR